MKYGIYKEVQNVEGELWITYVRVWEDEVDGVKTSYYCNKLVGSSEDALTEMPIDNCSVLVGRSYEDLRLFYQQEYPDSITYSGWYQPLEDMGSGDSEYALQVDLELLQSLVDTKADSAHTHSEYAPSIHAHDDYATVIALDTLEVQVNDKADVNHTHAEYASTSHTHDDYAPISHTHSDYAETTHAHDNYATTTALSELSSIVSNKANASHSHSELYYTETEIDTKLANKANSTHNHDNAYDIKGASANALTSANAYTDSKIDALVGDGASTTLDTIGEISLAIEDNQDAIDLLNAAIGTKANASSLSSHTGNSTIHITSTERNNWNIAKTHADSAHAPSNAEKNQNAFSNIAIGNTTIAADTTTDTFTLVAGNNVTLTPNVEGDSVTIAATNTIYTHPTTAGNKHIPAGGSSGQILRWSSDGTAVWGADNNTTYSNATQSISGLMSDTDKTKLDGIAVGANKYVLPSAGTSLGGVKTGGDVTISNGVITINDDSHNHIISNIDGLQSALDSKAASSHSHNDVYYTESEVDTKLAGKANSSHSHSEATTSAAGLMSALDKAKLNGIASGANAYTLPVASSTLGGVKTTSTVTSNSGYTACPIISGVPYYKDTNTTYSLGSFGVTATASELNVLDGITATTAELNYIDGVTSNIQTQLNGKASSSHTHNYAGSSSAGGVANSATKLSTARTISLTGDVTGSTSFDGSGNVSITATVSDDSHNHTIANVDGLQTALDGKSATSHTHTAESLVSMANALFATSFNGGVEYSYGSGSGKNVLTEISNMSAGLHTIYSIAGTTGNPKTTESWRMLVHKTSATIGWVLAFDAEGSIYSNYQSAAGTFKGWRCIYDVTPPILWMGEYWCTDTQTVTPSKALSACKNGWVLVWSDYDTANEVSTNGDCFTTVIPKWNPNHVKWSGQSFIAAVPTNLSADGAISFCGKRLYVHDTKITGNTVNDVSPANDCCLRAIYEY